MKIRKMQDAGDFRIVGNHFDKGFIPCVWISLSEFEAIADSDFTGKFLVKDQRYRKNVRVSQYLENVLKTVPYVIDIIVSTHHKKGCYKKHQTVLLEDIFLYGGMIGIKIRKPLLESKDESSSESKCAPMDFNRTLNVSRMKNTTVESLYRAGYVTFGDLFRVGFNRIVTDSKLNIGDIIDITREMNEAGVWIDEVNHYKSHILKVKDLSVNEIELSLRAANCLNNALIKTVGELVSKTESDMLKYRNFGKKSLTEIKEKLSSMGLRLGMKFIDAGEEVAK